MDATERAHERVNGWGVDADPENDPAYPMKRRTPNDHAGAAWPRPSQQPETVEALHSNERPNLSAVVGTSAPPAGLSGMLRRFAFRYSESSYGHWLPLMLADRINVLEGIAGDLASGRIPNPFAERGWRAEWRHNRRHLLARTLARLAALGALAAYLRRRSA